MAEFDTIAQQYDTDFTHSQIGSLQRAQVWEYLDLQDWQGKNIIETNCGTGEDALIFAKKGANILATDISEEMLKVSAQKLSAYPQAQIARWNLNEPPPDISSSFDFLFSNFGGWNCLTDKEITSLGKHCHSLLKEQGGMTLVIMPRFCVWESLYFLAKGRLKAAFRRLSTQAIPAKLADNYVDTYYYSPAQIQQFLQPYFKVTHYQAIGFFVPPSYLEPFFRKRSKLLAFLAKCEKKCKHFSLLAFCSDHYLIHLEKK
ncbi:MAG: class I SAM-dependent methyltransferase [Bacteroidia bacterium]